MEALKTCRVCGVQAFTSEELENVFTKDKWTYKDGYSTRCKRCDSQYKTERYYKLYRKNKQYLKWKSYEQKRPRELASLQGNFYCCFCGEEIMKLSGKDSDSLAIHSVNGDHNDWTPENKVAAHISCHGRYHNIGKSYNNPRIDFTLTPVEGKNTFLPPPDPFT